MDNTFIWKGGSGSWTDQTQWLSTDGGAPASGDSAFINVGTINITGLTLDDTSITVSFFSSSAPAVLVLADTTIDAASSITETGSGITPTVYLDGVNNGDLDLGQVITEAPSIQSTGTFDNQGRMTGQLIYLDHGTTLLNQGILDSFSIQMVGESTTLDAQFINDGTFYNQLPGVGTVGTYALPIEGTGTILISSEFGVDNYFNGVGSGHWQSRRVRERRRLCAEPASGFRSRGVGSRSLRAANTPRTGSCRRACPACGALRERARSCR